MTFTAEQQAEYVAHNGSACPYCGSNDIEAGSFDGSGQMVECLTCHKEWQEQWQLTGIEEL